VAEKKKATTAALPSTPPRLPPPSLLLAAGRRGRTRTGCRILPFSLFNFPLFSLPSMDPTALPMPATNLPAMGHRRAAASRWSAAALPPHLLWCTPTTVKLGSMELELLHRRSRSHPLQQGIQKGMCPPTPNRTEAHHGSSCRLNEASRAASPIYNSRIVLGLLYLMSRF
jgi:hypothetical protein